jgi:hypothetical protein
MRAVHSVTIELHGGMLTLAFICIAIKVIDMLWARFLGEKGGFLRRVLIKASEYSSPTILMAAIGGVIGLLLSAYTGASLVPEGTLQTSPITLNKVMVTVAATQLWMLLIVFNLAYGDESWDTRNRSLLIIFTGGLGYLFSITGGSIGGTMAGKVSIMEPLWEFLGVDLHASWIFSPEILYIIVAVVSIVGVLMVIYTSKILEIVSIRSKTSNK